MDKNKIKELYQKYNTEINCTIIALIIGICMVSLGILKTIFLIMCTLLGIHTGKMLRKNPNYIIDLFEAIKNTIKKAIKR